MTDRRKERRIHALMWAMLHHTTKHPHFDRTVWRFLLEWAMLGGQPKDVPHD